MYACQTKNIKVLSRAQRRLVGKDYKSPYEAVMSKPCQSMKKAPLKSEGIVILCPPASYGA